MNVREKEQKHDKAMFQRLGEEQGRRRWSKDVLLLVLGSGYVLLIVSLDPGPDSSLP